MTSNLHAIATTYAKRWEDMRSEQANRSYLNSFCEHCDLCMVERADQLKQEHLDAYLVHYHERGHATSSINTRMSVVSGFLKYLRRTDLHIPYPSRKERATKWAMSDRELDLATGWFRRLAEGSATSPAFAGRDGRPSNRLIITFAEFVLWTVETGLRAEETLRLMPSDFDFTDPDRPALVVPGTKNDHAKVRVALSNSAATVAVHWMGRLGSTQRLCDVSYRTLWGMWDATRDVLGLTNNPTATLKGLRRTFASRCLRRGLPLHMITDLMRHTDPKTTMSYLRTFGLSDNDETRALLNKALGSGPKPMPKLDALEAGIVGHLQAMGFKVVLA